MKKISKIFAMLVVALVGLSLTACSDGDDLSFLRLLSFLISRFNLRDFSPVIRSMPSAPWRYLISLWYQSGPD